MAGTRGRSGPPGNQNAFRHGLAGIAQRRADDVFNPQEQSIREEILSGLLADKELRRSTRHAGAGGDDHEQPNKAADPVVKNLTQLFRSLPQISLF